MFGFAYNDAGRRETVSLTGVVRGEYLYNEEGRQVVRRTPTIGATIHVIHDLYGNRISEYDGSTGALLRRICLAGARTSAGDLG